MQVYLMMMVVVTSARLIIQYTSRVSQTLDGVLVLLVSHVCLEVLQHASPCAGA